MKKSNLINIISGFVLMASLIIPASSDAFGLGVSLDNRNSVGISDANLSSQSNVEANASVEKENRKDKDKEERSEKDDEREQKNGDKEKVSAEVISDIKGLLNISASTTIPEKAQRNFGGLVSWLRSFLKNNATTTTSNLFPKIKDIEVAKATTTASVSWETNENTSGQIKYGTNSDLTASSSIAVDTSVSMNHQIALSGLTPNTKYFYVISATDVDGNVSVSKTKSFHTNPISDLRVLFDTSFKIASTSADIIWITNKPTDGKIWVGTNASVDTSVQATQTLVGDSYFHMATVSNLSAGTQYYYKVSSMDASGSTVFSTANSFTTLAQ